MGWGFSEWRPYVSVADRKAKAARALAKLNKKTGQTASPVALEGRKIATTFWGKAWCDNLEAYSDYENRLPRGRTYVRNGSVVDLQITKGIVTAKVAGSELYKIEIKIKPLAPKLWKAIQTECAGKIDSLIELLQGKLSSAVMQIVTRREEGLFPTPKQIELDCSCPDWADMCKHVAASLYGVGARLDQNPGLLFLLRGVDPADLISKASTADALRQTTGKAGTAPAMSDSEVADVFGIELEPLSASSAPLVDLPTTAPRPPEPSSAPASKRETGPKKRIPRQMSAAARAKIAAVAKARWAKVKEQRGSIRTLQASMRRQAKADAAPGASAPRNLKKKAA
jgi:uncharacterized Zn finger protein